MQKIIIKAGDIELLATLYETATAQKIYQNLPLQGKVNRWGDEIYFTIPVSIESEPEARSKVQIGELGYWPVGKAFCIFWGPTPASNGSDPVAASPVNIFGKVDGDAKLCATISSGTKITIEQDI